MNEKHFFLRAMIVWAMVCTLSLVFLAVPVSAQDGPPAPPVLVGPADGAEITYETHPPLAIPNFEWTSVEGAEQYEICIGTDIAFTNYRCESTANTSYTPDKGLDYQYVDFLVDGTFYWHVRVKWPEVSAWSGDDGPPWEFTKRWAHPDNKPELLSPADGVSLEFFDYPVFEWTPVMGAAAYRLELYADPDLATQVGFADGMPANTYQFSAKLSNGTYYWRVFPKDVAKKYGAPSDVGTFTLAYGAPPFEAPQLITPTDGAYPLFTPTFGWEAVTGAEYYVLQYSSDETFKSDVTEKDIYATSYTPDHMANDLNFYWRVKAVSGSSESVWSEVRTFQKRWYLQPQLLTPTAGYPYVRFMPYFSWTPVPGAAYYKLYLTCSGNSLTVETVHPYYVGWQWMTYPRCASWEWWVTPYHSNDKEGVTSEGSSFGRVVTNSAPELFFPRYYYEPSELFDVHEVVSASMPIFGWSWAFDDFEINIAPRYLLQVGTTSDLASPEWDMVTAQSMAVPSWSQGAFTPTVGQTYYWRARGLEEDGVTPMGDWGQTWKAQFNPNLGLPPTTTTTVAPLRPINGDRGVEGMPLLEWWPIQGATRYKVEIASNESMSNLVETGWAQYPAYIVTDALTYGTYYWRAQAWDDNGALGDWGPVLRFQVAAQNRWDYSDLAPTEPLSTERPQTLIAEDETTETNQGDLASLYAAIQSATDPTVAWYLGLDVMTTTTPITYLILIDIDQMDNQGAPTDPLYGQSIVKAHRPEFALHLIQDSSKAPAGTGGFSTDVDLGLASFYLYGEPGGWSRVSFSGKGGELYFFTDTAGLLDGFLQILIPPGSMGGTEGASFEVLTIASDGTVLDTLPADDGGELDAFTHLSDSPMLMAPPNNLYNDPKTYSGIPPFRWQPQLDTWANAYQIQIAVDEDFASVDYDEVSNGYGYVSNGHVVPADLVGNNSYYWRVRTKHYDGFARKEYLGSFSRLPWRFQRLGFTPPDLTLEPFGPSVTFSWGRIEGTDQFDLQWSTDSNFPIGNTASRRVRNWRYTSPQWFAPATYYWRVRAVNRGSNSFVDGDTSEFVNGGAFTVTLPVPTGMRVGPTGSALVPRSPTLIWDASVLPATTPRFAAYKYHVEICENEGMSVECQDIETEQHSWTPSGNTFHDGTLYWRVRSLVRAGYSSKYYSPWSKIQPMSKQYPAPTLIYPMQGDEFTEVPTFIWEPVEGMAYYRISIDQNKNELDASPWVKAHTAAAQYTPSGEQSDGGVYYWRVCGVDQDSIEGPCSDATIMFVSYEVYLPILIRND